MKSGTLQAQAVRLSARAARIAADLLANDPLLPARLRLSLRMALLRTEQLPPLARTGDDLDEEAARSFVDACRRVCAASPALHSCGGDSHPAGG